jgi:MOSC domain-containing protein YiiM
MGSEARIVSVRTGRVRDWPRPEWDHHAERTWRTAYVKDEVSGPVAVTEVGLEGDEQAGRPSGIHGGPQMAVLAYPVSNYARWAEDASLPSMGAGGFGENLALAGPDEFEVAIGDRWETEHVAFEVSQPRGPCLAISRHWNVPDLMQRSTETARIGWYYRVLRTGAIARGETLRLAARPHPEWTIARVFRLRIGVDKDVAALRALSTLEALSPEWRRHMAEKLAAH